MANYEASVEILLVEDNPSDVSLTLAAMEDVGFANTINVVRDGVEALDYLHRRGGYTRATKPGLVLLDLNLPRKDGFEVLAEIKTNGVLRRLPVVVLTTSSADRDIVRSYNLHANCYIQKPVDMNRFMQVIRSLGVFWFGTVHLPPVD